MSTPHRATPEQLAYAADRFKDATGQNHFDFILDLRARIEALDDWHVAAELNQRLKLEHLVARIEALKAAQHAHAEQPSSPPIASDEDLIRAWDSCIGQGSIIGFRAVYDLGRQHGAAQATCSYKETQP